MDETGFLSELYPLFQDYVRAEKIADYTFAIYVNTTDPWKLYDYANNALKFPKQIWQPYWGNPEAAENFSPWLERHALFEGPPSDWPEWWPYDWPLTKLIGCGPYIFHQWNTAAEPEYVHVARFKHTNGIQYWASKILCCDITGDFKIDILDYILLMIAYDSKPGDWNWLLKADINKDQKINCHDRKILLQHMQLKPGDKQIINYWKQHKIHID